ncbi:uncharacterized protein LOC143059056 [Mytilus galloprovincialis]|uniref:uncharacterized protein LOC143059056 n=1 Tax=Mytilus galloprovincialis TaxID=29158 RepID=UPI003F7C1E14
MTVNVSLSLKKRIACSTIFNISCHIARRKYDIPNVNLTDVCDSEEKIENNSIFVVILISLVVFALISVIVLVKCVSRRQNNKKKDSKARKRNDNEDMVEFFKISEDKHCNNIA